MASEMRGLRLPLLVVGFGRFSMGSVIRFWVFQFRFVHHGGGYFVFFSGPVAEVTLAAARAAEGKFLGRF
jgi:hypothetical protein